MEERVAAELIVDRRKLCGRSRLDFPKPIKLFLASLLELTDRKGSRTAGQELSRSKYGDSAQQIQLSCLANSTSLEKAAGSLIASSESILRLMATPARFKPSMNLL